MPRYFPECENHFSLARGGDDANNDFSRLFVAGVIQLRHDSIREALGGRKSRLKGE